MLSPFQAQGVRPARAVATPLTTDILERIGALYDIEAEVRGRPPDVRLAARQNRTRRLVDALRKVLYAALRRLSPKSGMAKAEAVKTNESNALKALKGKLDTFLEDLAAIEQTLPVSLKIDASRIINEIRSSLSFARDASLPQALFRYETAPLPAMAPAYAGNGMQAASPEVTGNG